MFADRIEGKWIDAFCEVFERCAVKAGDTAAILSETSRPERRLYGYVAKATVRILAVMSGCEIVGEMHLPEGTKDGILGYMKLRDTFIHIGDAKVSFSLGSAGASEVNTVVVNRASIQLLCLAE